MNKNYYDNVYIPQIVRAGKMTGWIGMILIFAPVLVVTFFYGVIPDKEPLMIAIVAQLSINAIWWVVEPISFFPILGIPGTYITCLSGNTANLRIPCAAAALKATDIKVGTQEGSIISTIGICASVFVNIILLSIGVSVGSSLLANLPKEVTNVLNFLLPSLFGAVFAQFAIDDPKNAIVGITIGVGSLAAYNNGLFNWFPIDPFIPTIFLPIFGTLVIARIMYAKGWIKIEE